MSTPSTSNPATFLVVLTAMTLALRGRLYQQLTHIFHPTKLIDLKSFNVQVKIGFLTLYYRVIYA